MWSGVNKNGLKTSFCQIIFGICRNHIRVLRRGYSHHFHIHSTVKQTLGDIVNGKFTVNNVTAQYQGGDESVPGDVNNDGKVNVSDVTALVNMILGVASMDQERADVNGDGKVNVSDVTALINIILGVS